MAPEVSPVRPIGKMDLSDKTKAGVKALAGAAFLPLQALFVRKGQKLLFGQTGLSGQEAAFHE